MASNTGSGGGSQNWDAYHQQSAERCFCNGTSDCCTCRCCGLVMSIIWIVFGAYGAYSGATSLDLYETYETCPVTTDNTYYGEECCGITANANVAEVYLEGSCDPFTSGIYIGIVDDILSCIAGIAGCLGLGMFISWILLIPIGYGVVLIILNIITIVLLIGALSVFGVFFIVPIIIGIGIAILIMILFYTNYKLIKEYLQQ